MRTLLVFFLALAALSARANPPETPQPATPAKGTPADLSPAQKAAMDQVLDALLRAQARRTTAEKAGSFFRSESPLPLSELKIVMEEPTPVPGTPHAYRTRGKASFLRAETDGSSPVAHTRTFESISELDANGQTHVTAFTVE